MTTTALRGVAGYDPDDITTRPGRRYGDRLPAARVKVDRSWYDVIRDARANATALDLMEDGPRFLDWFGLELELDHAYAAFGWAEETACEDGWGDAAEEARETFGAGVKVWGEGRSSGWLVVDGIGDPVSWAECRYCDADAAGHPWGDESYGCEAFEPGDSAAWIAEWPRFEQWCQDRANLCADAAVQIIYLNVWCEDDGGPRHESTPDPEWHAPRGGYWA